MINNELAEKIKEILIKKAEGYDYTEETYEYQKMPTTDKQLSFDDILQETIETEKVVVKKKIRSCQNNQEKQLTLLKKKITTHHIPPDMLAIKILLENFNNDDNKNDNLENLSDEELIKLKDNILESLKNIEKEVEDES